MTEAEPRPYDEHRSHSGLSHLVDAIRDHVVHEHNHQHEEDSLREAAEHADFDLGADVAQPSVGHSKVDFDVDRDIGIENRSALGEQAPS